MNHHAAHSTKRITQELDNVPGTFPYRVDSQLALVLAALLISDQLQFLQRHLCGEIARQAVYSLVRDYGWTIKRVGISVKNYGSVEWETVYSIDKETIERALNEGGDKFVMTVLQVHLALKTIAS